MEKEKKKFSYFSLKREKEYFLILVENYQKFSFLKRN